MIRDEILSDCICEYLPSSTNAKTLKLRNSIIDRMTREANKMARQGYRVRKSIMENCIEFDYTYII